MPHLPGLLNFRAPFMHWRCLLLAVLCGALLLQTSRAWAEPSDADRATARALAAEGHNALQKKDYEKAEDRFRRADALVHAPTLVVDHARALVGLNRFAEAYRRYELVIREGVVPSAPWPWKRAFQDAEREIEQVKPRLSWLTVRVTGPNEVEVTVDGMRVPPSELGAPRAVDPGERVVHAIAPGFESKEGTLDLKAGESAELELELSPETVEVVAAPKEAPPPTPLPAPEPEPTRDLTLTYVAFGVGGAALATGIVTGILALGTRSDILSSCPDLKCSPRTSDQKRRLEDDAKRYRTLGTISGIGFGLGVAGAAAGVALLLTGDSASDQGSTAAVAPYLSPDSFGVQGSF